MPHDRLERVYKQCCPLLLHITRKFGVSPEVGDEIVQEAFLRLARQDTLAPDAACKKFLIVTTRNLLIDERRKSRPLPVSELESEPIPLEPFGTVAEGQLESVREAWQQLKSVEDFEVFADYYQIGWSTEEIASRHRIPSGTVRSKIHRLREKFRMLLDLA